RKYLPANGVLVNNYGGNIPLIRYSEVLLSYLEAMLEGSGSIDQTLLNNTINKVRGRAGVNMPAITTTDKNALRPILRKERRIELALEGVRLWDLKRWEILPTQLNKVVWGAPFPSSLGNLNNTQNLPNPQKLWYVGKWSFTAGQEIWPIPETEQAINPNLR
ncbi:MAG: RagB/SusD family nutrient uptake outer membrane protein, partial [Pedobacter sp.]|nr:RagB/SusD family nutrient uptake outer membrane protein [Pedobacter sp.]